MEERRRHCGALLAAFALVLICSSLAVGETTLAGITVGQDGKDLIRVYGEPVDKAPDPGLVSTYWFFAPDSHGTKLMLEVMPGDIVLGISAAGGPNPAIKTAKGVQLGDPLAKVTEAYGQATPEPVREGSPTTMLRYEASGMAFFIRDERVVQIDLYGDPDVIMPKVAERMVSDFRKRGKEEAEARADTGAWLKERGFYLVAIAQYRRALELSPKSWQYMNNIGSAYVSLREFAQARDWFARGVAEKPDSATLQYNLGNALCALGRTDEGRPHLMKAVELAGEADRDVASQALMDLGNLSDDEGRPDEAIAYYQKALKLAKETQSLAAIWFNLGVTYESKGDLDQARQAFETALSHDPEHQGARERLTRLKARSAVPATRE